MTAEPTRAPIHLLAMALLSSAVLFINADSSAPPLRTQDRDLFTFLRRDHPDLLRGLDLRPPAWHRFPQASLVAVDYSGLDLRGLRLSGRALQHVNLAGSHLETAEFTCVPMRNVSLSGAHLQGAHFDYNKCDSSQLTLTMDLNGADLTKAELRGQKDGEKCKTPLEIRGNLNGARFQGATLDCVKLMNTSKALHSSSSPSQPRYAGINFTESKSKDLTLTKGDFVFSNFWKAKLDLLQYNPREADLRFSTLESLTCPQDGCRIQTTAQPADEDKLSLNLRGSQINSNLPLPSTTTGWPALLCNQESQWNKQTETVAPKPQTSDSVPVDLDRSPGFWITKGNTSTCEPL